MPTQKVRRLHSLTADQLNLGQFERTLSARHGQTLFGSASSTVPGSPLPVAFSAANTFSLSPEAYQRDRPRIQASDQAIDFMCGLAPVDHRHLLIQHMGVAALRIVLRARRNLI